MNYPEFSMRECRRLLTDIKHHIMEKVIVGVDVSMKRLEVAMIAKESGKILGTRTFQNSFEGMKELWAYIRSKQKELEPIVVLEATGVYHENLVDFCYDNNIPVSVVLPNKIKHFAKAQNVKTKNDKVDAKVIARYGCAFSLQLWKPMSSNYFAIREKSRQLLSFKKERIRIKSRLHAYRSTERTLQDVISLEEEHLSFVADAVERLEKELIELVQEDDKLFERVSKIATIKGISMLIAIQVLCEVNGFELINNAKQLVSFAGLDVVEKQSGEYAGRPHISKKGNKHIRHLLYMSALGIATRGDTKLTAFYNRLVERNNGVSKKKAIVAVERKLLVLIYSLWKSGQTFNPNL